MEIENTSYYSLRQIYSTRIFLFGLVDVILLTAFCIFLHGSLHITLLSLLSQFVFPAVVTACICFGLLCNKKNVNEIPPSIKSKLNLIFADKVEEVLQNALIGVDISDN